VLVSNGHESIEFYYTEGRPAADGEHNHGTIWRNRPTSRYNVRSYVSMLRLRESCSVASPATWASSPRAR
jgi:hypothetical protein